MWWTSSMRLSSSCCYWQSLKQEFRLTASCRPNWNHKPWSWCSSSLRTCNTVSLLRSSILLRTCACVWVLLQAGFTCSIKILCNGSAVQWAECNPLSSVEWLVCGILMGFLKSEVQDSVYIREDCVTHFWYWVTGKIWNLQLIVGRIECSQTLTGAGSPGKWPQPQACQSSGNVWMMLLVKHFSGR